MSILKRIVNALYRRKTPKPINNFEDACEYLKSYFDDKSKDLNEEWGFNIIRFNIDREYAFFQGTSSRDQKIQGAYIEIAKSLQDYTDNNKPIPAKAKYNKFSESLRAAKTFSNNTQHPSFYGEKIQHYTGESISTLMTYGKLEKLLEQYLLKNCDTSEKDAILARFQKSYENTISVAELNDKHHDEISKLSDKLSNELRNFIKYEDIFTKFDAEDDDIESPKFNANLSEISVSSEDEEETIDLNILWFGNPKDLEEVNFYPSVFSGPYPRRLFLYGILNKDEENYLRKQEQEIELPLNKRLVFVINIAYQKIKNHLHQPILFSEGFPQIWVAEKPCSKSGGRSRYLKIKNCQCKIVNDKYNCSCGDVGLSEFVVDSKELADHIGEIEGKEINTYVKTIDTIKDFTYPKSDTLINKTTMAAGS